MTAVSWSPLGLLLLLTLQVGGEAASFLAGNGKQEAPFYKSLASKVGSLAAEADMDAQAQQPVHPHLESAAHLGADALKHWEASHQTPQVLMNATALGLELGGYAMQVRDREALQAAGKAHTVMREASVGASVQAASTAASSVGQQLAASGGDLLKQWAVSHAAPPQAVSQNVVHEMPDLLHGAAPPTSSKEVGKVDAHPTESPKARAFKKAHSMMHEFESAAPSRASSVVVATPPMAAQTNLVAAGGDLLANWAKMKTKKSAHKGFEAAPAHATATLSNAPSSNGASVHSDLQSLRSTMRDLERDKFGEEPVAPKHDAARLVVLEDKENMKKAMREMASRSGDLHHAMARFGDGPVEVLPSNDKLPPADAGVKAGDEELMKWSTTHQKVQMSRVIAAHPAATPKHSSVDVIAATAKAVTGKDLVADDVEQMQKWHTSAIHDAMRNIGSGVADLDSVAAETQPHVEVQKSGADALEEWSKAHQPKRASMYMNTKREALLSPSTPVHAEETKAQHSEATDVTSMAATVSNWHTSAIHFAMRMIGSDAPVLDVDAAQPVAKSLEVAGTDALENWSKAHEKAQRHNFMFPAPGMTRTSESAPATMATPAVQDHAEQAHSMVTEAVQHVHIDSALHDAMRNIGSDVPDQAAFKPQLLAANSQAAGSDVLEQWSEAHEKATRPKFVMPVVQQRLDAPASPIHEYIDHPVIQKTENWHVSVDHWRQSAAHEAMRSIGSDVADVDTNNAAPKAAETLEAAGADVLDRWAAAHKKAEAPKWKFTMPADGAKLALTSPASAVSQKDSDVLDQHVEDAKPSVKQLHESAIHEAMREIGNNVVEVDPAPSHALASDVGVVPQVLGEITAPASADGQGLMDNWSKAHSDSDSEEPARKPPSQGSLLVDMYPPTAAPVTDMVALAMARGFGKKASDALEAQMREGEKAGKLHEAMESMTKSLADDSASIKEAPTQEAAIVGADILSQWANSHKR